MQNMRSEYKIDIRKSLLHTLRDMLLLNHTAADRYYHTGISVLYMFERSDIAEYPVLGILTHRTGIVQNKIGIIGRICEIKAHFREHTVQLLTVGNILLTAVAVGVRERFMVEHVSDRSDTLYKKELLLQFFVRYFAYRQKRHLFPTRDTIIQ